MELNRKNEKGQEHNGINESVDTLDRISQLPQHIIHEILSFLPTKDVAKTSLLSKTWLHSWSLFPNFDFNESYFHLQHYLHHDTYKKKRFMNFINDSLQRCLEQNLSINKFRLCVTSRDLEMDSHIERWVSIAMERNAKELDLSLIVKHNEYNLPKTVLDSTTITVLKLSYCNLMPYRDIKFSHLQKLYLNCLYIDEHTLENVTSGCPSIKDLRMNCCHGLKYLKVLSLLQLNRIELRACFDLEQIRIGTQSLQTFYGNILGPCEIDLTGCENLKELNFWDCNIKDQVLQDFSSKFPNLEFLVLTNCRYLNIIDISSQKLKRMGLRYLQLEMATIHTPNLIALEIVHNHRPFHSNIHTPKLREVELQITISKFTSWYDDDMLNLFLGNYVNSNGWLLVIRFKENAIIHEDSRGIRLPPLEEFGYIEITSMKFSDLLDKLIYRHNTKYLSIVSPSDSRLLKTLYGESRCSGLHYSLEEIESFDWGSTDCFAKTMLKLYEKIQYKTTTFGVRYSFPRMNN